jgi:HK97 family phage major capsid protein
MEAKFLVSQKQLDEAVAKTIANERKYAQKFAISGSAADEVALKQAEAKTKMAKFVNAVYNGNRQAVEEIVSERAKALNETTSADGGYLVPIEFEKGILMRIEDYSKIRKLATVVPMSSNVKKLNSVIAKVTVNKTGELQPITASRPTFGEPVLTAEKYTGSTTMSSELEEDAETSVIDNLMQQYAEQFAYKEQYSFINSTVSGSEGLLVVSGVSAINMITGTTFSQIQYDDCSAMIKKLFTISPIEAENGTFLMSYTPYDVLAMKKDTTGNYLLPVIPTEAIPARILGRPVVVVNEMPQTTATATKFVIYADLKKHLFIGDRRAMRIKVNTSGTAADGTNLNSYDGSELVITKRTAQVVAMPDGVVTLATN